MTPLKKLLPIFLLLPFVVVRAQTVTDIDGNIYNTITLGTQTWMQENLKTTHYNNGIAIPTTLLDTYNDSTVKYQWFYNQDTTNLNTYGRLYSWYSLVSNEEVCPIGWHVPSQAEWLYVSNLLGGDSLAGYQMKDTGTAHWLNTESAVSNASGFTGLPGGFRGNSIVFLGLNTIANFWSATPWGSNSFPRAYCYNLQAASGALLESVAVANCGLSVRCVKNNSTGTGNSLPVEFVRIFPDPAADEINILFKETGVYTVTVYNSMGALVLQKQLTDQSNQVAISFLPDGIYLVKINGNGFAVVRKILKN